MENFEKVTYNKNKFQSFYASTCGPFVICFIYFMSIGFEFTHVNKMFKNSNNPDQFVHDFIQFFDKN